MNGQQCYGKSLYSIYFPGTGEWEIPLISPLTANGIYLVWKL